MISEGLQYAQYLYSIFAMLLYVLPFLASSYCWWLIFLFPILFLYTVAMSRFTCWQWTCWVFCALMIHSYGLVYSLYCMAVGPWYVCALPGTCFVIYLTMYFVGAYGLVWLINRWCIAQKSVPLRVLVWTCVIWAVLCVIGRYCMVPLGSWQGYPCLNPLIPIAVCPQLLWPLGYLGADVSLFFFLALSAAVVVALCTRRMLRALFISLLYGIWFAGAFLVSVGDSPSWIDQVAVFACSYPAEVDGLSAVRSLADDLQHLVQKHPTVQLVIMPESALSASQMAVLHTSDMQLPVTLFAGGYHVCGDKYYNSVFLYCEGHIGASFAKRYPVAGTEYVLSGIADFMVRSLYVARAQSVDACNNERPCIVWRNVEWVPYICSELFLSHAPDDAHGDTPLIAFVNDTWCKADYLRHCMYLCARFKAIAWQRDIVYASFFHAAWLTKTGDAIALIRA